MFGEVREGGRVVSTTGHYPIVQINYHCIINLQSECDGGRGWMVRV